MANLLPPLPILDDIANLPSMQLQAYSLVYELPTLSISLDDMRANLRRVRQIYQGDVDQLTDNDRRTLFDSWGLEGDWSTAPSDDIAVVLVGYALSLSLRYNALGYCRSPLEITNKNPSVVLTTTGECDITVEVEALATAGQPLTGTGECDIVLTVDFTGKASTLACVGSALAAVGQNQFAVDTGSSGGAPLSGVCSGTDLAAVDQNQFAVGAT